MELIKMYGELGISEKVLNYGREIEKSLHDRFEAIDKTAEYNQLKVIKAMQEARVSDIHFAGTTGYGYNDLGRDTLEEVYAKAFHGEDALVRPQLISGTHALTIALSGNLRPGDEILSPVGKPYDTLEEVIGIRDSVGSLKEFGITYSQVDLLPNGDFDFENIKKAINERTKLIEIQRSKGYATRPTLSVKRIGELISFIKSIKPDVICMVDNCYGEFVEEMEPTDVGAGGIPPDSSGSRKRGWCQPRCQPVSLPGTFPVSDRCCGCIKGRDFRSKRVREAGLRRRSERH